MISPLELIENWNPKPWVGFGNLPPNLGGEYLPLTDEIRFSSVEFSLDFPWSVCHEMAHATGHKSRLYRPTCYLNCRFARQYEELLACLVADALCGVFGWVVHPSEQQHAYRHVTITIPDENVQEVIKYIVKGVFYEYPRRIPNRVFRRGLSPT